MYTHLFYDVNNLLNCYVFYHLMYNFYFPYGTYITCVSEKKDDYALAYLFTK